MDTAKVIDKLNEILRWEWTGLSQYAQYSYVVHGMWREVYHKLFHDSAEECFGHADKIAAKIVAYGGVPTIERERVKQTKNLQEMLANSLEFESQAVRLYNEALGMDIDQPLRVLLEDIILEEQDGVDELTKLLREDATAGPAKSAESRPA